MVHSQNDGPSDTVELAGWTLRPDPNGTRELYADLAPLTCDCAHCRNLVLALPRLPEAERAIFDALGIDLGREAGEVYAITASREDGVYYGGSMLALGELVAEPTLSPELFPGGEVSSPQSPLDQI